MTDKGMTIGELIKELEKLPKHLTVKLSVNYDDCNHIQPLGRVYSLRSADIDWILLIGKKETWWND